MTPFDLEAFKQGEIAMTRDGREAHFLAHVPQFDPAHQLIARIEEDDMLEAIMRCIVVSRFGKTIGVEDDIYDALMKPKCQTREFWVNCYADGNDDSPYRSEQAANFCAKPNRIDCMKVVYNVTV